MNIRFTADSTCDMSPEFIERFNVRVIPLSVELDGVFYKDGIEIHPDDIFAKVGAGADLPKTSAINVGEYQEMFGEVLKECDAIIHFNISSDFSSCHQNACIAAEGKPVYCVDSRHLSTGIAMMLAEAWDRAQQGMTPEQIIEDIKPLSDKIDMSFIIDRLDYLYKGGRCSMVAMLGANVLHLRPCIEVVGGKMVVGKKYRGTYERCAKQYLTDRLKDAGNIVPNRVFIPHTGLTEEALHSIQKMVTDAVPFAEIYIVRAGCSITSHCGENVFGINFLTK